MSETKFTEEISKALKSESESDFEKAGDLFEQLIEVVSEENEIDFSGFIELAILLAEKYWPTVGMCMEPSSQLFSEYGIGEIEWIWENEDFRSTFPRFLEVDLHFGCFVLTEDRADDDFIKLFNARIFGKDCEICAQVGEGWISPAVYICENIATPIEILKQHYDFYLEIYTKNRDWRLPYVDGVETNYEAVAVLRAIAGNFNTPREILEKLSSINDYSLRHETRYFLSDHSEEESREKSFIDWAAKQTLLNG